MHVRVVFEDVVDAETHLSELRKKTNVGKKPASKWETNIKTLNHLWWLICPDNSCMFEDVSSMQTCRFQSACAVRVRAPVESDELPCACGCKCWMWPESPTPAAEALGARCQLFQTRSSCCSVNSVVTSEIRGLFNAVWKRPSSAWHLLWDPLTLQTRRGGFKHLIQSLD